jgi:anti-sigma factor ChrR (cupin superfamily)
MMLDRIGAEKARATSIVRYAPDSRFPPHAHPGGEEILVLSGTFSDETGDFPAGCYLRNPPGTSHQPSSAEGALIFVKLRQMAADDDRLVRIDTREPSSLAAHGDRMICPLFSSPAEQVCLQRLEAGQAVPTGAAGGAELLVLDGRDRRRRPALRAWELDTPAGRRRPAFRHWPAEGACAFYMKTGHLAHPVVEG